MTSSRKIILHCELAPGDVVMLTAAVRDLHLHYPGQFVTDVRTFCPPIWEENPYITPLDDHDPEVEHVKCKPRLINEANWAPYHCLHGFVDFLNLRFGLNIKPTAHRGDIHLSAQDKAWDSQVKEITQIDIPFWIVAAGGKHDITIKWWEAKRYQEVIDAFKGKIQFVQVGGFGDHHPKLHGAIDLRGQTDWRELVRLVYHSQGVLCAPTALMHLAAAVEIKQGAPSLRAGVIISGGREPVCWEQYPGHQYLHTIGMLPCCATGGCWKDRSVALRDGDSRDEPKNRCANLVGSIPKCMDMITSEAAIGAIEKYFAGGLLRYLSPEEQHVAKRAVTKTVKSWYDSQKLSIASAGMACDEEAAQEPPPMPPCVGRGIVICAGGVQYFTNAWVCVNMLRRLGCQLPIEIWHLGRAEMTREMEQLLKPLGVKTVDAVKLKKEFPVRRLKGWELKAYSILHSSFAELLFLDADVVPVANPEFLFETDEYKGTGAIFWPDFAKTTENKAAAIWTSCGLTRPDEQEFESGQILVDRRRCWKALNLTMWFNEQSDFYYTQVYGDKETFHLAFQKVGKSYHLIQFPIVALEGTMCQHDPHGRRIFQHRNRAKWDLFKNKNIRDFAHEKECLDYVVQLRDRWDSNASAFQKIRRPKKAPTALPRISVVIAGQNASDVRRTKESLARCDWNGSPVYVAVSDGEPSKLLLDLLRDALQSAPEYVFVLRGAWRFNRHLRYNLSKWEPLQRREGAIFCLHNPQIPEAAFDRARNARFFIDSKLPIDDAVILPLDFARFLIAHGNEKDEERGGFLRRAVRRLNRPIICHAPSLAQRWPGSAAPRSFDFDVNWRASS